MFNNVVLDVFIGLIFIFLLYSLLATVVMEIIATQLAFRSKILERAILRMLEDGKTTSGGFIISKLKGLFYLLFRTNRLTDKAFATAFYSHPLIKYLAEDSWFSKPSYISAKNFSKVILDLLRGIETPLNENSSAEIRHSILSGTFKREVLKPQGEDEDHPAEEAKKNFQTKNLLSINPETRLFLMSLYNESGGDEEKFRIKLEEWFDDTMNRASDWYKRYSQGILFLIGLFIAVTFNVDTIQIGKKLASDPKLRAQVVQNASVFMEQQQELGQQLQEMKQANLDSTKAFQTLSSSYEELTVKNKQLFDSARHLVNGDIKNLNNSLSLGYKCDHYSTLHLFFFFLDDVSLINFWGWVCTALAISLGAPFWFDLLNKIMKLRSAGSKGETNSTAPGPKDPVTNQVRVMIEKTGGEVAG
jgi:hypothetical protein